MAYHLGIDLGTTYTAAAVERDGRVEVVTLGNRTVTVPSVLFTKADGEVLVGDVANRRGLTEPERVAREFKRRLGDPVPVLVAGTPYAPEVLSGKLLRWVVERVAEIQDGPARSIALTHPANWGPFKIDLLTQGARQAGVPVTRFLTEPEAAATSYASQERIPSGSVIAVYDLGGGTFDVSLLRKRDDGFDVLGSPDGVERLGGIDFDHAVFAHVSQSLGGAVEAMDANDPDAYAALARLRSDCVDAKEALSADTDVSIPVSLPNVRTAVRLTRGEFEGMIRPALAETVVAFRRALRSAGLAPEHVTRVLLVGGSSRIPLVARMLTEEFDRPVAVDANPKDVVALGAAVAAAQAVGAVTPETVLPVFPPAAGGWAAPPTAPVPASPPPATPQPTLSYTPVSPPTAPIPGLPHPPGPQPSGAASRAPFVVAAAVLVALAIAAAALALGGGGGDDDGEDISASDTTTTTSRDEEATTTPFGEDITVTIPDTGDSGILSGFFELPSDFPEAVFVPEGFGIRVANEGSPGSPSAVIFSGPGDVDAVFGQAVAAMGEAFDTQVTPNPNGGGTIQFSGGGVTDGTYLVSNDVLTEGGVSLNITYTVSG